MGGTLFTIKMAEQLKKPCFIFYLQDQNVDQLINWIRKNKISTLNIAGPRESQESGIYEASFNFVQKLLLNPALKKDVSFKADELQDEDKPSVIRAKI